MFVYFIDIIRGKISVISTSKIKKIIAIRKKCKEKGRRAKDLGSNPHSKGDDFSRSEKVFFEIKLIMIIINMAIIEIILNIINNRKIIYTKILDLLIGS